MAELHGEVELIPRFCALALSATDKRRRRRALARCEGSGCTWPHVLTCATTSCPAHMLHTVSCCSARTDALCCFTSPPRERDTCQRHVACAMQQAYTCAPSMVTHISAVAKTVLATPQWRACQVRGACDCERDADGQTCAAGGTRLDLRARKTDGKIRDESVCSQHNVNTGGLPLVRPHFTARTTGQTPGTDEPRVVPCSPSTISHA